MRVLWTLPFVIALLVACDDGYERPESASIPTISSDSSGNAFSGPKPPPAALPLPWWAADADPPPGSPAAGAVPGSTDSTMKPAVSGVAGKLAMATAGAPAAPALQPTAATISGLPNVKFEFGVTIPAGKEMLRCIYAAFPSDRGVIAVPSAESHYTPGSHHLLAYRSDLTAEEIPPDKTGVWDCDDGAWQTHNKGSYYEAQEPEAHRDLPIGIAHKFQPGEVVILQAHYLNSTDADLDAHVELTLHTIDPARVVHEAGSIIFSNLNVTIAAHSRARATMTCTLPQDMYPVLLWSHMHRRGVNFVAETDDAAAAGALGALYEEKNWAEPVPREFPDPAVMLPKGSRITFSCDYENEGNTPLKFGNSAELNEMCLLHGMYWPRMPSSGERCSGGVTKITALGPL